MAIHYGNFTVSNNLSVGSTSGTAGITDIDLLHVNDVVIQSGLAEYNVNPTTNPNWGNRSITDKAYVDINSFYQSDATILGNRTVTGDESLMLFTNTDFKVLSGDNAYIEIIGDEINIEAPSLNFRTINGVVLASTSGTNQKIKFNDLGATPFLGTLQNVDLTSTQTWELPDSSGTIALETYTVYSAFITQSGTNAPTSVVVENTLASTSGSGIPVWTRDGAGSYTLTQSGGFSATKTSIHFEADTWSSVSLSQPRFYADTNDTNSLYVGSDELVGAAGDTDGLFNGTFMEIRVYP